MGGKMNLARVIIGFLMMLAGVILPVLVVSYVGECKNWKEAIKLAVYTVFVILVWLLFFIFGALLIAGRM